MPYRFNQQAIKAAIMEGVEDGLTRAAIEFQRGMIQMLSQPGGGPSRTVGKGKRRRKVGIGARYPRSLPGQPPAAQTGTLKRSWQAARPSIDRGRGTTAVRVSTNIEYAPYLEDGTPKMRKRPSVAPVLRIIKPQVRSIVEDRVRRRLSRFNAGGR